MSKGDCMLEALRTRCMKPGTLVELVDRTTSDPRRLIIEFYPKGHYYRISYRTYDAEHNSLSGRRNVSITWKMYFVFSSEHTYTTPTITLPDHTYPPSLTNSQVGVLQAATRGETTKLAKNGFHLVSEPEVKTLWSNLKLWTRL